MSHHTSGTAAWKTGRKDSRALREEAARRIEKKTPKKRRRNAKKHAKKPTGVEHTEKVHVNEQIPQKKPHNQPQPPTLVQQTEPIQPQMPAVAAAALQSHDAHPPRASVAPQPTPPEPKQTPHRAQRKPNQRAQEQNKAVKKKGNKNKDKKPQMVVEHGTVVSVVFRKPDSAWGIVRVRFGEKTHWAKGELYPISVGAHYQFGGVWEDDARWGRGMRVRFFREVIPAETSELLSYLEGLRLPRLTSALCEQIVKRWGLQSLQVIEEQPELLEEFGLSQEACLQLQAQWKQRLPSRSLLATPESWGLNEEQARSLFEHYGGSTLQLLRRDPYHLLNGSGLSFSLAEQVAERVGIERQDPRRVRAAFRSILENAAKNEGHTALLRKELLARTRISSLQIETSKATEMLAQLEADGKIMSDPFAQSLGLPKLLKAEQDIAKGLLRLAKLPTLRNANLPAASLTSEQALAVVAAQQHRCLVLTGYPGTGKTYTLRAILESGWENPLLTAPTGKAAKRLSELTGRPAFTLHRLLEYSASNRQFGRGKERPLDADLLIVDEAAMLDVPLASALVRSIDFQHTTLLLCGDANQLPPVGPGNFLLDVILSKKIPVVRLQKIVRQDDKSQIIPNARRVLEGEPILVDNDEYSDFKFFPVDASTQVLEQQNILHALHDIFQTLQRKKIMPQDVQILSPMKKGEVPGATALNKILQGWFNPPHPRKPQRRHHQVFRLGDRVIQLRNDYERGVFNGDTGIITKIEKNKLFVTFDEKLVEYDDSNLSQLELSYAISIHKSQGSEWPVVILPLSLTHRQMFSRRLLYTAMTRAKKLLILVGCEKAVSYAISQNDDEERITTLRQWLEVYSREEKGE